MVCADDPERILALQPRVADQYVLQCVVERMADVERARHIGRRNHDSARLRIGPFGPERAGACPMRIPARLDGGGVEGLVELASVVRAAERGGGKACVQAWSKSWWR